MTKTASTGKETILRTLSTGDIFAIATGDPDSFFEFFYRGLTIISLCACNESNSASTYLNRIPLFSPQKGNVGAVSARVLSVLTLPKM